MRVCVSERWRERERERERWRERERERERDQLGAIKWIKIDRQNGIER